MPLSKYASLDNVGIQLAKQGEVKPHQLNSLKAVQFELEQLSKDDPKIKELLNNFTMLWRLEPKPEAGIAHHAVFRMELRETSELIEGTFTVYDADNKQLVSVIATSGARGYQSYTNLWTRGVGPIPDVSGLMISTTVYDAPEVKGVEGKWFDILPIVIKGANGESRSYFGLHRDANVPGTAGCIGVRNSDSFNRFIVPLMSKAKAAGVQEIPLEVIYNTKKPEPIQSATQMSKPRQAILDLIAWCEGTDNPRGYQTIFGYHYFSSFKDHPRYSVTAGGCTSDAAGRYQFKSTTWDECQKALNLPDFSPESQDKAAIYLIARRGILPYIDKGELDPALSELSWEWASIPTLESQGSYDQPFKKLEKVRAKYKELLAR